MTALQDPPDEGTTTIPRTADAAVVATTARTTVVPATDLDAPPDEGPRPVATRTLADWVALGGSAASALALDWVLYDHVLPFSGKLGFVLSWYLLFILSYCGITALEHPLPVVRDRLASAVVHGAAAAVGSCLASVVVFTFHEGWPAFTHANFFTSDMSATAPTAPLDQGGITHAIVGSLVEVGIAVAISMPLGIAAAVYMTEVGGKFARVVRTVIEAMTALPDLVAGLFVYAVLIIALGFAKSGLAAAIALSITMMPIIARSSEVVLRVVPSGLREASLALGASQWRTVLRVVLPTARPGLGTALILGVARGIGETAPVLIVAAESTIFTANPVGSNPMNSLPLFIYSAVRSGQPAYITRGYGAAAVLLAMVLVLFVFVRILARQRGGNR